MASWTRKGKFLTPPAIGFKKEKKKEKEKSREEIVDKDSFS